MNRIFFPGSFNPFTVGHADLLKRMLTLADKVTVGIGVNIDKISESGAAEENKNAIMQFLIKEGLDDRVDVVVYSGLSAEEAIRRGADCLARGVRNATDFDYEYSLASANKEVFGIETVFLAADPKLSFVSSTLVRDLEKNNKKDIASRFIP